jgi:hypothetical protein
LIVASSIGGALLGVEVLALWDLRANTLQFGALPRLHIDACPSVAGWCGGRLLFESEKDFIALIVEPEVLFGLNGARG